MKTIAAFTLALLVSGATNSALAHGEMAAWYGGQITETASENRIEFAVRDGGIRVWVRDHSDKPVAASGKAVLLVGSRKLDVPLKAEGDMLSGDVGVNSAAKLAAILSLSVNGKAVSARFSQEAVVIPQLSAPANAGKQAFEQVCAACHGVALRGSDTGPSLLHPFYAPGSGHGDDIITSAVINGAKAHHWKFGDMPKPEGIKPGQEKELLAYIRAMQAANGFPEAPSSPIPMDHSKHMNMK